MGIDLGTKRIGVATSDATGTLASPYTVIERRGDRAADHRAVAAVVAEVEAERVVVGLPLSLSGHVGASAQAASAEAGELAAVLPVPVETFDERLTTVSADRALQAAGTNARDRRRRVDSAAAAVMLQAWLDGRR
ncbi:MAG TPA: Holliday junction resolvase RuvX [Acidimicrobiales bacterium]|nr:Holliday junction resolvase RuvX [Acidimicrobiales bacterium]